MLSTLRSAQSQSLFILLCLTATAGCSSEVGERESAVGVVQQQLPGGVSATVAVWLRADGQVFSSGTTQAANGANVAT